MTSIPKHILITMPNKNPYLYGMKLVNQSILYNKDWKFKIFDDNDCDAFIASLSNNTYKIIYHQLIPGAYKADFIRLLLLYKYGGVYLDAGLALEINLNYLFHNNNNSTLLLTYDRSLHTHKAIWNGFMASIPKHPFIKLCIKNIVSNVSHFIYGPSTLSITGPILVHKSLIQHLKKKRENIILCDFHNSIGLLFNDKLLSKTKNNYYRSYLKQSRNNKQDLCYNKCWKNKTVYKAFVSYNNWMKHIKKTYIKHDRLYAELKYNNEFNLDYVTLPLDNTDIQLQNINGFFKSSINYIPNNIFQIDNNPSWEKWNHCFNYQLYDNNRIDTFFKQTFKGTILNTYKKLSTLELKKHFWKYCIVYTFGGIYVNKEINCHIDPSIYIKNKAYIVVSPKNTQHFNTDFFAAPAKSPIIKMIIDLFIHKVNEYNNTNNSTIETYLLGPNIMSDGIFKVLKCKPFDVLNHKKYDKIKSLYVIPHSIFNTNCISYNLSLQ